MVAPVALAASTARGLLNTFDAPHTVEPAAFAGVKLDSPTLSPTLLAKLVVVLALL